MHHLLSVTERVDSAHLGRPGTVTELGKSVMLLEGKKEIGALEAERGAKKGEEIMKSSLLRFVKHQHTFCFAFMTSFSVYHTAPGWNEAVASPAHMK